jgi:hypothetical protein
MAAVPPHGVPFGLGLPPQEKQDGSCLYAITSSLGLQDGASNTA